MDTPGSAIVFDLEYFFELSPDLLCVAGYDGYFKKINPAVSKALGYTNDELFAKPINFFVHPDDQSVTSQKRESLIEDNPLLNFENRYVTKSGHIIWLSWTSMPIKRDRLVFAIAKNITYKKKLEEYKRISAIINPRDDHFARVDPQEELSFSKKEKTMEAAVAEAELNKEPSQLDQDWLDGFEMIVRKHTGKTDLNIRLLSNELAVSERQLFRRVNRVMGITPNKLARIIRLQLAREAIATGKYRTIAQISTIAGYSSRAHFSKLFKEIYGVNVTELL